MLHPSRPVPFRKQAFFVFQHSSLSRTGRKKHEKTGSRFHEPVLKKEEGLDAQVERLVHHPGRFLNV